MKKGLLIVVLLLVIVVVLVLTGYNGLVRLRENVNLQWSNVEVNYQRRADLIPNLVESVKGFAEQEAEVFENIARLRSGFDEAETPEEYEAVDRQLTTAINIAVEAYPELKSDALFLGLMDELAGTENRIAVARRDYNDASNTYNVKIKTLPASLYAGALGFTPVELFEAVPGSETAPTVNFG